jgi:hypothetical protein
MKPPRLLTMPILQFQQMARTSNKDENKRVIMDLDVVLRSHDCPHIVRCLGCFITEVNVRVPFSSPHFYRVSMQ